MSHFCNRDELQHNKKKSLFFFPQRFVAHFEVRREKEENTCLKFLLIFNFSDHLVPVADLL